METLQPPRPPPETIALPSSTSPDEGRSRASTVASDNGRDERRRSSAVDGLLEMSRVRGSVSSAYGDLVNEVTLSNLKAQAMKNEVEEEAKILGELESIQVLVRVRPMLAGEKERESDLVVDVAEGPKGSGIVTLRASARRALRCKYDHVLGPAVPQDAVYAVVKDCAARVMEGYNSTIMAYGQTGSGKTHTMFGPSGYAQGIGRRGRLPETAGVIPRAITDIFQAIRQRGPEAETITVYCSFVQIYNEQLYDMLRDGSRDNPLVIHEDKEHDIYVQGLSEFMVKTVDECLALLKIGEENRAIRETHMNQASSRSHSLFQLVVEQRSIRATAELEPPAGAATSSDNKPLSVDGQAEAARVLRSKLNLVDLAGSEKWDTQQNIASQHAAELTSINLSLFTLGRCIAALSSKTPALHVPYRDSKLTRLIQDSLGGNCRTRIIATLSPTADCVDESVSTLKFADRAKQVLTYVRPVEKPTVDHLLIEKLQREVSQLRSMLVKVKEAAAHGPGGLLMKEKASHRHPGMTVDQAMERVEIMENELRRERSLNDRLRQENGELRMALDASSRMLQETGSLQSDMETADAASAAAGVDGGVGHGNGPHRDGARSEVHARLEEVEGLHNHFKSVLARFFAFEIEEAELRSQLAPYVATLDEYLNTPPKARRRMVAYPSPNKQQGYQGSSLPPISGAASWDSGQPESFEDEGMSPSQRSQHQHEEDEEGQGGVEDSLLPKLYAEGMDGVAYRIRGKKEVEVRTFRNVICRHDDEEQKLVDQLKEARKRLRKHMKLQEWLLQKEQRELEAAEREEAQRRAEEQAKKEANDKFRERARRQKKRLEAYYASLKKKAEEELYGLQQDDDAAVFPPAAAPTLSPPPPAKPIDSMPQMAHSRGQNVVSNQDLISPTLRAPTEEDGVIQPPTTLPEHLSVEHIPPSATMREPPLC